MGKSTLKFAVVGYGYWGPNFVRNLQEMADAELLYVCDKSNDRLSLAKRRFPGVSVTNDYSEILSSSDVDAIIVATPTATHYELGMLAITAGKHVLIEKPIASSSAEARRLIEAGRANNVLVAVDHTFVYTGAVRKIKSVVDQGALGDLHYVDSVRVNLGLFQHDVNVAWDLAVHDLSIIDYITGGRLPTSISATGSAHISEQENIAYLSLQYDNNFVAHIHVNWLAPVKVRQMLVGGSSKMLIYDDVEPSEKIRIYDRGVNATTTEELYKTLIQYRTGDMHAPLIDPTEAISTELREFIGAVQNGSTLAAPAEAGLRIVQILEAASTSMRASGSPVAL